MFDRPVGWYLFWIGVPFLTAIIAGGKGRNPLGWFFAGVFFSLLALIAVIGLPSKPKPAEGAPGKTDGKPFQPAPPPTPTIRFELCPNCNNFFKPDLTHCPRCGQESRPRSR